MASSSASQKILVIGATGSQGSGVIRHCTNAGHFAYAFVRNPESESAKALQNAGVPLVQGELDDFESLCRAMTGMTAVFFIVMPGSPGVESRQTKNVVEAAKLSGSVKSIFYSGALLTGSHESFPNWGPTHPMYQYWLAKDGCEQILRESGLPRRIIIRPATFLQNFIPPMATWIVPALWTKHVLKTAYRPDLKLEVIDCTDVGRVIAHVLGQPEQFSYLAVDLAVEGLTMQELATKIGRATGNSITAEHVEYSELEAELGERIVSSHRLFNEIGCRVDVDAVRQRYNLTPVEDFFRNWSGQPGSK
ncbi:hypothetical protein GGR52DRAFT_156088 [Hypoxylon sp. FL1284]|nr:hypothetical protein GGR52DRAFT_156088 [Hypoxylon sp. FL1284]